MSSNAQPLEKLYILIVVMVVTIVSPLQLVQSGLNEGDEHNMHEILQHRLEYLNSGQRERLVEEGFEKHLIDEMRHLAPEEMSRRKEQEELFRIGALCQKAEERTIEPEEAEELRRWQEGEITMYRKKLQTEGLTQKEQVGAPMFLWCFHVTWSSRTSIASFR